MLKFFSITKQVNLLEQKQQMGHLCQSSPRNWSL